MGRTLSSDSPLGQSLVGRPGWRVVPGRTIVATLSARAIEPESFNATVVRSIEESLQPGWLGGRWNDEVVLQSTRESPRAATTGPVLP